MKGYRAIPSRFSKLMTAPRIIVYGISANPPTWGHADLMMRASTKFDQIHWVAALNPKKKSAFNLKEKMLMMKKYVDYYRLLNVTVASWEGAIIRYAEKVGAQFLLRGLRNTTDCQYELELAAGNRGISKEIESICLFSKPHYATISSSLVRELAILGENISQYVLPSLETEIVSRLSIHKS